EVESAGFESLDIVHVEEPHPRPIPAVLLDRAPRLAVFGVVVSMIRISRLGHSMASNDRMVSMSMSGGSLQAATCREIRGWNSGSKRGTGRVVLVRVVTSRLSEVK